MRWLRRKPKPQPVFYREDTDKFRMRGSGPLLTTLPLQDFTPESLTFEFNAEQGDEE